MKIYKILLLCFIPFILTACKSDRVNIADHISPLIIEYHQNKDVSTKLLSRTEKKLFEEFIESQKITNKIINISEAVGFSQESYEAGENTNGIYKEGEDYFIKYTDLTWESIDDDYKCPIVLNHMGTLIFRSQFPVLYDETKDNINYRYRFYKKNIYDDHLDYYYKSIGNDSGLIIRYHNNSKGKVQSISLIYQELFFYSDNTNQDKHNESGITKLIVIGLVILFVVGLVVLIFIRVNH